MGIIKAYIAVFDLKKSLIAHPLFPKLVTLGPFDYFSAFGSDS
jgi:hypothetical protein